MPTHKDDDEAAMQAVLDDMGRAARAAKAKRYEPKAKAADESETKTAPDEDSGESSMPSLEELEGIIGGAKSW